VELVKETSAKQQDYDLIFMDVQMPNMDGLEATRLIRSAGFKRPIVALSAYSDDTNVRSCHESGMDDFVSKPIQIARLKLVLKTFCPYDDVSSSSASAAGTPGTGPVGGSSRERERGTGRPVSAQGVGRSGSSSLRKETATAPVKEKETEEDMEGKKAKERAPVEEDISPLSSPAVLPPK
jgi:osomolarity two-component system, sensor histidine kinase SLN1